jgi:hypothetical protein
MTTKQPHSLRAKLASLAVGETLLLPHELPEGGASALERRVKSTRIGKFRTMRCDTITSDHKLIHTLLIDRVQ